jgi:hypothetical protein
MWPLMGIQSGRRTPETTGASVIERAVEVASDVLAVVWLPNRTTEWVTDYKKIAG